MDSWIAEKFYKTFWTVFFVRLPNGHYTVYTSLLYNNTESTLLVLRSKSDGYRFTTLFRSYTSDHSTIKAISAFA